MLRRSKSRGSKSGSECCTSNKLAFKAGFTIQSSKYEDPQEFDERKFVRTPNDYGYFTTDFSPSKKWGVSATGTIPEKC